MNIIVTDSEGRIDVAVFSHEECENAEQVQEEIKKAGGEEKVIAFLRLSKNDDLGNLFSAHCAFGDGLDGSFQYAFEELLAKVFQLGQEYYLKMAKEKLANGVMRILECVAMRNVKDDLLSDKDGKEE